jgi:hypothetical protein
MYYFYLMVFIVLHDDLTSLFSNLTKDQKKKINELIETINEKDDILES